MIKEFAADYGLTVKGKRVAVTAQILFKIKKML